ncbi:MAG: hypothetical protein H6729_09030 [Deltaproteobacteria bacterium]|nr:hypothetical protein [Deltaproteobacteria bacterium]
MLRRKRMRRGVKDALGLGSAVVLSLLLHCQREGGSSPVGAELGAARRFYQSQPVYLRPFDYSPTPAGLVDIRAESCGVCHVEIYEEWKISTHARAWLDDAQFQEELKKSRAPGRDVAWMCVNCHTPLENQLPHLVAGLHAGSLGRPVYVANPNFDPRLQEDAITCGTCHVRDGVIVGPWGDKKAPHPVRRDEALLSTDVCTRCHDAQAEFPELTLACVFDTGREFAASPYAEEGYTCQSCHMPEIVRPAALGAAPRKTRRHWFGGSLIPKKPEFAGEMKVMQPHFKDGLSVRWTNLPGAVAPGKRATLQYILENENAGHLLPTGDPERFIDVVASVRATNGSTLAVEKTRIGAEYIWYPKIQKRSDNRLKPKERRTLSIAFSAPPRDAHVTLHLRASKWRISEENFRYHALEGRYVAMRVFVNEATRLPIQNPAAP